MKRIKLEMSDWQVEMIRPMIDKLIDDFDSGNPSAMFAQVVVDTENGAYLDIILFGYDICNKLQEIVGQEVGKMCDPNIPITVYIEEK